MNLDVSIPNLTFSAAARLAEKFNLSWSELFTAALAVFVTIYGNDDITAQLNEIYAEEDSSIDPGFTAAQVAAIGDKKW